ncbi:MAG: GNAT family N-acetyltransferase [Synechococcaceae cyanobacterium]|nr:GNAT family N-acetyltransferase [Synechococcaceae cyanobacterium]
MLRRLRPSDVDAVLAVYHDAVITQATGLYTIQQIQAWAAHAANDPGVRAALLRGHGLVSHATRPDRIEGFALLDPPCRLSLLYCRGSASRQGHGRALVQALEAHAQAAGCRQLRTEASRLSRPLLERLGWQVEAEECVLFAGVHFGRWRMIRDLT